MSWYPRKTIKKDNCPCCSGKGIRIDKNTGKERLCVGCGGTGQIRTNIMNKPKRKYKKYNLEKIYHSPVEVRKILGVSAYRLVQESKKLFPEKYSNYLATRKKMKYRNHEIEVLRISFASVIKIKKTAKQVVFKNPDHLFDGFDEIVEMQG